MIESISTKTLTAILVGGPKDGHAMRIPEMIPPVILVPFDDVKVFTTYDPTTPQAYEQDFRIAEYQFVDIWVGNVLFSDSSCLRLYMYVRNEVDGALPSD